MWGRWRLCRSILLTVSYSELLFWGGSRTDDRYLVSAHDPKAPYYDASSKPSDPKWSVVHVEFRSKFEVPIGLKELRAMGAPGKPLENMQMLKQSRLSVSKVSAAEWKYLMGVAEGKVTAKKK